MAGNSAVTWGEVAAMVGQVTALWKAGTRPAGWADAACLTHAEFRAHVLNNGAGTDTPSLITLDEFTARKLTLATLEWSTHVAASGPWGIVEYDLDGSLVLRTNSLGAATGGSFYALPQTRRVAAYNSGTGTGYAATAIAPGQTWKLTVTNGVPQWARLV